MQQFYIRAGSTTLKDIPRRSMITCRPLLTNNGNYLLLVFKS